MNIYLGELTWVEVQQAISAGAVVVVPVGSLEQHGPHLPLEVDWRLCATVAEAAAREAQERGVRALVTPPIWTGFSPHHMDFPGSITLDVPTFIAVVSQVARSLWHHGFRKVLLLNGHGGNANLLRSAVQQLRFEHGVRAAVASYWDFVTPFIREWRRSGRGGIDHACEMETALMLAVRPELVQMERARDSSWFPTSEFLTGDLTIGAPVTVAWSFKELTEDGGLGDAPKGEADRGRALLDVAAERIGAFIAEFHRWNWQEPLKI